MIDDGRRCAEGHRNPADAAYCVTCGSPLDPDEVLDSLDAPVSAPNMLGSVDSVQAGDDAPVSGAVDSAKATGGFLGMPRGRGLQVSGIAVVGLLLVLGVAFALLTAGVPDVSKLSSAKAQQAITSAGFAMGSTVREFSQTVPRGSVVSQDPAGGSRARKGSQIELTVSRGPAVVVPDLSGVDISSARSTLVDLKVAIDSRPEISETVREGAVVSQEPAPGTMVEQDSVVSLVVSAGPPTTTLTATVDLSDYVLEYDWLSCSTAVIVFAASYENSTIVNRSGQELSTLSGRWKEDPSNGNYFPCSAVGSFPSTPTNEVEYRVQLSPTESGNADWFTRAELESTGWSMKYR